MDLKLGETCTALIKFISAGTAHTFILPFDADKAIFTNLTKFGSVAGYISQSIWYKDGLTEPYALQYQSVDTAAVSSFSSLNTTTNGFTQTNLPGGAPAYRANITAINLADPAQVTTSAAHGYQTNQIVRITDLGDQMPVKRGASDVDGKRFMITVNGATTFLLRDPVTGDDYSRVGKEAYVTGGRVDLESRVISLNNPQVTPYDVTPYVPTPFEYDPVTYRLKAGTAVMGADNDKFRIDLIKFGQVIDLGDLLT